MTHALIDSVWAVLSLGAWRGLKRSILMCMRSQNVDLGVEFHSGVGAPTHRAIACLWAWSTPAMVASMWPCRVWESLSIILVQKEAGRGAKLEKMNFSPWVQAGVCAGGGLPRMCRAQIVALSLMRSWGWWWR